MSASGLVDWLGLSDTLPQVKPTTLPLSYFKFPPASAPTVVPPPPANFGERTLAHPFTIPTNLYNDLLKPQVPITVALVYMSLVSILNQVNARRNHKPWVISRTRIFKLFVILHNIFLAVYSAWTFVGMVNAVHHSLPAWDEDWRISKTADALCKLHGPRGAGNAASYNSTTSAWAITNRVFHLAADGLGPEATDAGRIWNEGLAFYGWLFYLSKFYEVVDTLIILAKGRKSSLLQTYHHAGAMLSMWAGIRYMSPPIWMFVLVNSGIHAIMYTFYLLSTVGVKSPKWFKQSLTTLQISQFIIGTIYAFLHLFVAYQIPVSVPYLYQLGSAASRVVADAPTEITSSVAVAVSTAAGYTAWLKKAVLRGAGYEGLAENVLNEQGRTFGVDAAHIAKDAIRREETRYRDDLQWVHCLDTSGQVFAILLNCVYLLPLTVLFVQFFVQSYRKQAERRRSRSASDTAVTARNSFLDASKDVSRRLNEAVQEMHNVSEEIGDDTVFVDGEEVKREMQEAAEQVKDALKGGGEKVKSSIKNSGISPDAVKQEFQRDMEAARKTLSDAADKVTDAASNVTDPATRENIAAKAQSLKDSAGEAVDKAVENVKSVAGNAQEQVQPAVDYASEKAGDLKDQAGPTANSAAEKATELKDKAVEAVKGLVGQAKESTPKTADEAKDEAQQAGDAAKAKAQKAGDSARGNAQKAGDAAKDKSQKAGDLAEDKSQKEAGKAKNSSPKKLGKSKKASEKAGDAAKDTAKDAKGNAESAAQPKEAQKKADDLSRRIADNAEKGPSSGEASQSEVEKFTSQDQKSPNGNGTGAEGASEKESDDSKEEKKEEDKIIDESQVVRDEEVDPATDNDGKKDSDN